MHYYGFNIDAYYRDTSHLSDDEDLAYRKMIDVYMRDERPLQGDVPAVARLIRFSKKQRAVASVLAEFFERTDDGWRNGRCEAELEAYRKKLRTAVKAGKASGKARAPNERPLNDRSTPVERPLNDRCDSVQPINPNPNPNPNPVPLPHGVTTPSPPKAGEQAQRGGDGERGAEVDAQEADGIFARLCATSIRAKVKNRRQVLRDMADELAAEGMLADQCGRLWKKARAESSGDPGALFATWLRGGAWREKWHEIIAGKVGAVVRRVERAMRT